MGKLSSLHRKGEVTKPGISYTSGWWFKRPGQIHPRGEPKGCALLQVPGKIQNLNDRGLGPEQPGKELRFIYSMDVSVAVCKRPDPNEEQLLLTRNRSYLM